MKLKRIFFSYLCHGAEAPEVKAFSFGSQFSSRPSLVPSVTVVLLKFSDRWVRSVTHKGHGSKYQVPDRGSRGNLARTPDVAVVICLYGVLAPVDDTVTPEVKTQVTSQGPPCEASRSPHPAPFQAGRPWPAGLTRGEAPPGTQAPSHAGSCQTDTVGKDPSSTKPADRPVVGERGVQDSNDCVTL